MFVDDERFDLGFFQQYYQCTVTLTFDLETDSTNIGPLYKKYVYYRQPYENVNSKQI